MKRILALTLSAALLLALLCACGGADNPEVTVIPPESAGDLASSAPSADTTQEPSLALPGDEPTEEVSEEPSAEPSQEPSAEPTQRPSQAPATQAPATQSPATQAPATQAPSTQAPATQAPASTDPPPTVPGGGIILPGGGGSEEPTDGPGENPNGFFEPTGPSASDVNLASFYQTVLNSYDFPAMDVLPADFAANYYPGLFTIPVVQRLVSAPIMTGTAAAEITLVQVVNSSDVSTVKSILQARVDSQAAGGAFYPMAVEGWQNNARVESKGNYVTLVVHEDCDAIISQFRALF